MPLIGPSRCFNSYVRVIVGMVCGPGAGLLAKVFEVCDGMALSSLEFRKLAGGLMRQLPEVRCAPANQPRDKGTVSLNVLFHCV